MNESDQHDRSASVSERRKRPRTQPALDVRSRWLWTEGSVWTDRMLTALEQGVKGGKWFRLFDKVFSKRGLYAAAQQVLSEQRRVRSGSHFGGRLRVSTDIGNTENFRVAARRFVPSASDSSSAYSETGIERDTSIGNSDRAGSRGASCDRQGD